MADSHQNRALLRAIFALMVATFVLNIVTAVQVNDTTHTVNDAKQSAAEAQRAASEVERILTLVINSPNTATLRAQNQEALKRIERIEHAICGGPCP